MHQFHIWCFHVWGKTFWVWVWVWESNSEIELALELPCVEVKACESMKSFERERFSKERILKVFGSSKECMRGQQGV
jgi:hypothetical protein